MKPQQLEVGPGPPPDCPVPGGLGVKVAVRCCSRVGAGQPCPQDASSTLLVHAQPPHPGSPRLHPAGRFLLGGPCAGPLMLSAPFRHIRHIAQLTGRLLGASATLPSSQAVSLGPMPGLPRQRAPGGPRWPCPGPREPRRPHPCPPHLQQLLLSWRPPGGLQDIVQGGKVSGFCVGKGNCSSTSVFGLPGPASS